MLYFFLSGEGHEYIPRFVRLFKIVDTNCQKIQLMSHRRMGVYRRYETDGFSEIVLIKLMN